MCTIVFTRNYFLFYISFEYQSCITSDIWGIDTTYWTNNVFIFIRKLSLMCTKVSNIAATLIFANVANPAVEKQSWTFCVLFNLLFCALHQCRPPLQASTHHLGFLVLHILLSHQNQQEHFSHSVQIHFQRLGYLYISLIF